jgi:hypothetical protein
MPMDAARDAVIAMQARVIEVLAGQVRNLAARVERLASRNSGNSSMPPSADDLPCRTQPRRKPAGGGKRKPGKQPGAPGAAPALVLVSDGVQHKALTGGEA